MSAARRPVAITAPEAEGRLSRAAASVSKRETKLAELRERLAALTAASDDEDNILPIIVLKREIRETEEELAAYREARSRAQKALDVAAKEAEAREKAAHLEELRTRMPPLRTEVEKRLAQLVEAATACESLRSQLEALGIREAGFEQCVENVNRKTADRHPREGDSMGFRILLVVPRS